jgi:hypothetical protein
MGCGVQGCEAVFQPGTAIDQMHRCRWREPTPPGTPDAGRSGCRDGDKSEPGGTGEGRRGGAQGSAHDTGGYEDCSGKGDGGRSLNRKSVHPRPDGAELFLHLRNAHTDQCHRHDTTTHLTIEEHLGRINA